MADYRNLPLKFFNAGLDLNLPPEGLAEPRWRRLDNTKVITESVLEGRPLLQSFSMTQPTYPAATKVQYPDSFPDLGPLVYMCYVGPLGDGTPGYLTIHKNPAQAGQNTSTPNVLYYDNYHFSCFVNGMPVVAMRYFSYGGTDAFSYQPALITSQDPPSVTRILSVNGPSVVIIDGRWKIYPSTLNLTLPTGAAWLQDPYWKVPVYISVNGGAYSTFTTTLAVKCVPAYRVGVSLDPYVTTSTTSYLTVAATTTTGALTSGTTYQYAHTYRNKVTGSRSPGLRASPAITINATNPSALVEGYYGMDPQVTQIEIWRRGGNIGNSFRLVTTLTQTPSPPSNYSTPIPSGGTYTYNDTVSDATIALNEALDTTLTQPFPTVDSAGDPVSLLEDVLSTTAAARASGKQLTTFGPFLGQYVFWLGDPVKRANFYWNKQSRHELSTADLSYNAVTDPGEELVNGVIWGGNPYIFSKRKAYALDYGGPLATPAFVPREVPNSLGLHAKWGVCTTKVGAFFVNSSGIYATDLGGSPPICISDDLAPIFRGESVLDYVPVDWAGSSTIRLCGTSRELHFFYNNDPTLGSTQQHLVYDLEQKRWSRWTGGISYIYELEDSDEYKVVCGNKDDATLKYFSDATQETGTGSFTCKVRTGHWDSGVPLTDKEFGVLMLDFDPDGVDVQVTPFYDSDEATAGTPFFTGTASAYGRRTLTFSLGDEYARSLALEFQWTKDTNKNPKFYQATVLFRVDEEGIVHWHHPLTALGQGEWFHIQHSFWTVKSSAAITLQVEVDGVVDTYTIPSTGGVRRKVYVEHRPRKGKLYSFTLDSSANFYLYGEESGIFGKSWKTSTGYQSMNPFAAAGYAQYLRKEGGT